MIFVPNIDSKIWNIDQTVIDIILELKSQQCAEIDLNLEGPCAESLGLYRILDQICNKFGYSKNEITIYTCNQIESHSEYDIKISSPMHLAVAAQEFLSSQLDSLNFEKSFDHQFFHFGIFIGRSNLIRLWLASALYEKHKKNTLMTYHWKIDHEFHSAHLGLDDMLSWNASTEDVSLASGFLQNCPLDFSEPTVYPILVPANLNICKIYHQFLLEIVCETYYSGASFFPTEKTWRPLLMKTPFIVHGPVGYLENLKKLGFKTFDRWWDEEYDNYSHDMRLRKILSLCDTLQTLSLSDMTAMYKEMIPVLEHNHRVFINLNSESFRKNFPNV